MKDKICVQVYHAPCGDLWVGSWRDCLCLCNWVHEKHPGRVDRRLQAYLKADFEYLPTPVTREAVCQLEEYFSRKRQVFDLPLLEVGTAFQKDVWKRLREIPYGQTWTYAALAAQLGMPSAVRAVANANGANALSVFIPCHRVIGSNGALTGYAGGTEAKLFLLELERDGMLDKGGM